MLWVWAGSSHPFHLSSPLHNHTYIQTQTEQALEEEVKEAANAQRRLKLVNSTLRDVVATKARNDEEEEGKLVGALARQNRAIRALLVRWVRAWCVWVFSGSVVCVWLRD